MIDPCTLDFDKAGGLIPVVVQDAATLQVLTLAYMDRAALDETLDSGEATFFSRSRGGRWRKGETSGDRLHVVSITPDCDADSLRDCNTVRDAQSYTDCECDHDGDAVARLVNECDQRRVREWILADGMDAVIGVLSAPH